MEPYNIKMDDPIGPGIGGSSHDSNSTIDEPALDTLMRDLKAVGIKMRYVMLLLPSYRSQATDELKVWDLWGPLLICLLLSISLALISQKDALENFVNVFLIFWVGAFITSLNAKLLGSKGWVCRSLFQWMSVVGYCLMPLALFGMLVSALHNHLWLWLKLLIIITALAWSTFASMMVGATMISQDKKWLAGYPLFLFYIFLAWYSIVV